jgi:DNA-binding PadR family transcriptional regulator
LWDAVLEYLVSRDISTRVEVLERFSRDSEAQVRGILRDLVESGLVFCSGSGPRAMYRAISEGELESVRRAQESHGLDDFVWAVVYRHGPASLEHLAELVKLPAEDLRATLERLVAVNRVQVTERNSGTEYSSAGLFVEQGAGIGWEASVYDHFNAMVRTICARLENDAESRQYADKTGGSTYSFDVGPEHPLRSEVLETLNEFRARASDLRARVVAHNEEHGAPQRRERVVAYAGLSVLTEDAIGDEAERHGMGMEREASE